jgi:hypothetical protein
MESTKSMRLTNSKRILTGLGRMGRAPQEAICDIVDNAVSAGAKNVYIRIGKLDERPPDNRWNNVKEYLIIDDGSGMTVDEIENALDLGSDDGRYHEGTLSKFGLGLKSASFANGDRLEIISGVAGEFHKEYVDLQEIDNEYFSMLVDLDDGDFELIEKYLPKGTGTIVRVAKIRNVEHPNIRSIIDGLRSKLGVIYYYFIRETGLKLHLLNVGDGDSNVVEAFDPLFVDEIPDGAMLDENDWDGRTVSWLMAQKEIVLGSAGGNKAKARVEMTQLVRHREKRLEMAYRQ